MEFIGMAGGDEDFRTLERMANEAKMYGAQASFQRPSLNANSLSQVVSSSLSSSLSSRLELTSTKSGTTVSRSVRTDVQRERQNAPDDIQVNNDWRVFQANGDGAHVGNVWTWSARANDFAMIIDPRCMACFKVSMH